MSWWKYVGGLSPGPAAIPNLANPSGLAARLLRTRPAHLGHHLVGARRGPRNVVIERGDGTQVVRPFSQLVPRICPARPSPPRSPSWSTFC